MKPGLLLIGHTYAALENRKKLQALAAHFDLVCVTSTIEQRTILGRPSSDFDNDSDAPSRSYQLIRLPRLGKTDTTFRYTGLAAVMRSRRFDVILVENEPWALVCWQTRLWKSLFQRDALFGEFTWENVERPGWKGLVLAQIYRCMTLTTNFIIAGNHTAAQLVQKRGARASNVHIAPQLGVDLTNHIPANADERIALRKQLGLPSQGTIVGYCGRFADEKGISELVTVCARRKDVHLAMLGSGPRLEWLKTLDESRPWFHLLSPRPHWEIPDFLRCLDLFVLASKPVRTFKTCWEEQFGHVLIEAMACGVATLGSNSGAIPEVIGTPEAIFRHADLESLDAVLERFRSNERARGDLVTRQLARTRQLYTHDAVAASWAAFIQQQLSRP